MKRHSRSGFTIAECLISLGLLITVSTLVAQHAVWAIAERGRIETKSEALEIATNLLEEARDKPWDDLTEEWAKSRKLPESSAQRWPNGKLIVRVETEPKMDRVKRVTVEVMADQSNRIPVKLTTLFAARKSEAKK